MMRTLALRSCNQAAAVLSFVLGLGCVTGSTAEQENLGEVVASGQAGQTTVAATAAGPAVLASEAEIASALDNYRVRWNHQVVPAVGECDTGWRRQVGEAFDGVDSLVLDGGCAQHAVEIRSFVVSPAELRFYWKADVGSGDILVFEARPVSGGEAVTREREHTTDWEQEEVSLTEPGGYRLVWSYVKNGFDDPVEGPGQVALDKVEIEGIDGSSYGTIDIEVSDPAEDGSRELAWATLPGRGYQLFWKRRDREGADREGAEWEKDTQGPMPADGERMTVVQPRVLYEDRVYRVELVEPPSFVTVPADRQIRRIEGAEVSLSYEVESSDAEVAPLSWIWTFRKTEHGEVQRLPGQSSTLGLGPLSVEDEGIYSVTVTNGAGSETAPPVTVEVFQPPAVRELQGLEDGEVVRLWSEVEGRTDEDAWLLGRDPPLVMNVEPGGRFEIAAEIGGSRPLTARWQRLDAASGEWRVACRGGGVDERTSSSSCERLEEEIEEDFGTVQPMEGEVATDSRETVSYRLVVTSPEWGEEVSPTVDVGWKAPPDIAFVPDGELVHLLAGDLVRLQAVANASDDRRRCYRWFVNSRPQAEWAHASSIELRTEVGGTERELTEYEVHGWSMDTEGQDCVGASTVSGAVTVEVSPLEARELADLSMRLLPVLAGSFRMGTTGDAPGAGGNEQPIRDVVLTHSFWLQNAEVSRDQWFAVMDPSGAADPDGAMPATVTYDEAKRFIATLNERERAAERLAEGLAYALPTEAQWERAARLAVGEIYVPGRGVPTEVMAAMDAHRAGEFRGLLGNVWEWAADWYASAYDPDDTHNPRGPEEAGLERALRGGGEDLLPEGSLPTARYGARPDYELHGFRVALVRVDPPETLIIGRIGERRAESFR